LRVGKAEATDIKTETVTAKMAIFIYNDNTKGDISLHETHVKVDPSVKESLVKVEFFRGTGSDWKVCLHKMPEREAYNINKLPSRL
jgi:hypothetical protein